MANTPASPHRRIGARLLACGLVVLALLMVGDAGPASASAFQQDTVNPAVEGASDTDVVVPAEGAIAAGAGHTCALTQAGGVKCWGSNDFGALGIGQPFDRLTPTPVVGLGSGVTAIAAGGGHTCALTGAGGVKCWGNNTYGGLGDGTTTHRSAPVDVVGLTSGVTAIGVGGDHSCALLDTGAVKCWGFNWIGQLGDGTNDDRSTPVDVIGLGSGVQAIAVGYHHTCAVMETGAVRCWGLNDLGALGDGTTDSRSVPVDVVGLASVVSNLAAGQNRTCAVTTSGEARCWGAQPGDGSAGSLAPVTPSGLGSGVARMTSGGTHTCALTTMGSIKCWGWNVWGQLGDGTTTDRDQPVDVVGLGADAVAVDAGVHAHTCAITAAGAVKCWGRNDGRLGDGTRTTRLTPADVSGSFYRPECATLVALPHTEFSLDDGYAVGSIATFRADQDYALVGPETIQCEPDLAWDGSPPAAVLLGSNPLVVPGGASVGEGDTGVTTLDVPVTLTQPSVLAITVEWTTLHVPGAPDDTVLGHQADPADDYLPSSGTVTFAPGQTTATVRLTINGDLTVEDDEYLVVSFHDPTHARMGGFWGLGFAGIINDDMPTVLPGGASVGEGDTGVTTLDVPVTLTQPSVLAITVEWTTLHVPGAPDDTVLGHQADPADDYLPSSGTVTFAPGQTTATVRLTINGDLTVEDDEYLVVSFHDPTHARMGGFWGLGFAGITNDDAGAWSGNSVALHLD